MTKVCPNCFGNKGLQSRIVDVRPQHPDGKCDFHSRFKGIPITAIAEIVDVVFRNNYGFSHYHPKLPDMAGESLSDVLYSLTGADDPRVITALSNALINDDPYWPPDGDEPFYQEDARYERTDDAFQGHSWLWQNFCRTIVHEQRFFNDAARELLSELFEGLHRQRDISSRPPVFTIEPGSPDALLLRARLANEPHTRAEIEAGPSTHMGPPPLRKRRPGRMNPSGISAFYGAYDLLTCIAELRPRVGDIVACAEFEITRPIVALDMTRFDGKPKEPNLFSKEHVKRMAQWRFMQSFMHEISQPISPDDEHLDYIPTQAVGEFLQRHLQFHLKGKKHRIEAVIFRSAQHPAGMNIVLLGEAAAVEPSPAHKEEKLTGLGDPFDAIIAAASPPVSLSLRYRPGSLGLHRIEEATFRPARYFDLANDDCPL